MHVCSQWMNCVYVHYAHLVYAVCKRCSRQHRKLIEQQSLLFQVSILPIKCVLHAINYSITELDGLFFYHRKGNGMNWQVMTF